MANEYAAAGLSHGLLQGFESARARRYRDVQDALRQKEVDRQHEVQDFELSRARVAANRADEQYPTTVADQQYARDRNKMLDKRADDAYPETQDELKYQRSRERALASRQDEQAGEQRTTFQQGQEDRQKQIQAEGVHDFAKALIDGADPNYALQRFNQTGVVKIDPATFKLDPTTKQVSFTDNRGKSFNGTLEQLGKIAGVVAPTPIKLGKDDRLIDPVTHQQVVGPSEEPADADGNTGPGGKRKTSPYNPESVQQGMTKDIALARGAQMDVLGNWSVADPGDRQVVNYAISLAQDMEGRLRKHVASGEVTPGEISNAVVEATGDMPKESELTKRAADWRSKNGATPEQTAGWLEAERAHVRAGVEAKLAKTEQRLLGKAAAPAADTAKAAAASDASDEVPTVDSDEAYKALASGKQFKTPAGKLYTKP